MTRLPPVGAALVPAGLLLSAAALGVAPVLMPDGYSWVSNTTSESAAQGVPGAWLARAGFVLFGLAVLLLVRLAAPRWGAVAAAFHTVFGTCMIAAAAFSTRPWMAGAEFDRVDDLVHSVAATAMGFAFAGGVVAVLAGRGARRDGRGRRLDAMALAAAVAAPLAMVAWPGIGGVLQRAMFAVAYAWYGCEARRHPSPRTTPGAPDPAPLGTSGPCSCAGRDVSCR